MTLGEKLRMLRQQRDLTQPQLADVLSIEQSYLSKLENGKSVPSPDMLARILEVLGIDLAGLLNDLDRNSLHQLRQIPQVAEYFNQHRQSIIGDRRRWLILSALLLALGAGLIYAGHSRLVASGLVYNYESAGISPGAITGYGPELVRDHDFQHTTTYRGLGYVIAVLGGSRLYTYIKSETIDPWQNKVVAALGVLLAVLGLIGLAMEHRLAAARTFP